MKAEEKERFIYKRVYNWFKKQISEWRTFKSLLSQVEGGNLSTEFKCWLLDVFQYGLIIEIIHAIFWGWNSLATIAYIIAFGLLRWILFDTIKMGRKTIMGRH